MPRLAVASALIAAAALDATPAVAQDEAPAQPSAEQMIEVAREAYRPPGLAARCTPGSGDEIVVCAPDQEQYQVSSSIEDAIAADQPVDDGIPRAPDVWGGATGGVVVARGCMIPPCPRPMPPLIDYSKLPDALTPEEAARVFRAGEAPSPAGASPADAP
jgi:hypothetical protein